MKRSMMKSLMNDESGQDLIEYGLVAALIPLGAVAAMTQLRSSLSNIFTNVQNNL